MNCREFTDFIMAWMDGELPPDQAADFEAHVRLCPPCVTYLDQYKAAVEAGRKACEDEADVPADVPEELIQTILSVARRARRHGGDTGPDRG